jgi:nucleoside-diphosphate-sugar epimerase
MRVVVTGATGNVGTSVLQALADEPVVESVVGLARRRPTMSFPKTSWTAADVETDDLTRHFRGADAVVHLAWRIQPSHDLSALRLTNVHGSARVFRAVAECGVPALLHASSVGVYSPAPDVKPVDESWPRDGVPSSFYSRHKAEVERLLDRFEGEHPDVRVVRMRPALIFKRDAASGIRRLFLGPFLPTQLLRPGRIPILPLPAGLRLQAVHSLDVGDAYRRAIVSDTRGAFNVAAEPVFDAELLASVLRSRAIELPHGLVRGGAGLTWRLRLQPTPPGWIDLALGSPILDSSRARQELGWAPRHSADEALLDLLAGLRDGAGIGTPPLSPNSGGPGRLREIASGVGGRDLARTGA